MATVKCFIASCDTFYILTLGFHIRTKFKLEFNQQIDSEIGTSELGEDSNVFIYNPPPPFSLFAQNLMP